MDSTYTIIIADDHPLFRNALFQSVHMAISGANLLEADSLDALLTLLKKDQEPDLLLLDLKMPGANGLSGLIHLRSEYPDLPIVVVSASEDASVVTQVKSHGAFGFIPKSSDMRELVAALNQVLGGEPFFPEGIITNNQACNDLAQKIAALKKERREVKCGTRRSGEKGYSEPAQDTERKAYAYLAEQVKQGKRDKEINGAELGRTIGTSDSFARRLKKRLLDQVRTDLDIPEPVTSDNGTQPTT